jgi:uncharacterized protein YerC
MTLYNKYQKAPYRRYRRVSDADVAAVREGIEMGWTQVQIKEVTGVGLSSISRIKRSKGLYSRFGPSLGSRRSGPIPPDIIAAVKQGVEMDLSYAELKSQFGVTSATVADVKRSMGLLGPVETALPQEAIEEPQQADSTYTPQQYFEAISGGIEEYHRHLAVLEARIGDLTLKNRDLHSELIQARAKIGTWTGPTQIPNRNMSTGG